VFSRFNPAAKRVLRAAEQACRNHNHYYVGVGHLLLALLEERDPGVEARLAERGTHLADLIFDLRRALGTGDDRLWEGILVTPRVRRVIAIAESSLTEASAVEPLHLFEAIIAEGGGLAAELLSRYDGGIGGASPHRAKGNYHMDQRAAG
jgi:ATP-dependent Clp protease ATP-binding subunit ClpA